MSKLVIVESPAKAKTIKKYLGRGYSVVASMGHVRDLPKTKMGVDFEHDFAPQYINIKGKGKLINELKAAAKKSDKVYLASDPDREGEAISWHLAQILGLDVSEPNRVSFNEITKTGIQNGMKAPRTIDMDLFNAQQARRILDRIVGYKLSPFLWRKVRKGLSAGRVQSVAVRLIVDREKEIRAFVPTEYWSVEARHRVEGSQAAFSSKLVGKGGKKIEIPDEATAQAIYQDIVGREFVIDSIKKGSRKRNPSPPFTTSTMQQEASRKLGFQSRRTMQAAQQLYEGIEIEGMGAVGLITYMRTDSLRISKDAQDEATAFIEKQYGKDYLPEKPRAYSARKGANTQDAHEAIRPTMPSLTPMRIKDSLSPDQYRLYSLIWKRFIASQMASSLLDTVTVNLLVEGYNFRASGFTVRFDGFTKVYIEGKDTAEDDEKSLPPIRKDSKILTDKIDLGQHFTEPPPRYTEATLIKAMEENGIGRPSTYAPTITTILGRGYVERQQKMLVPTSLGEVTTQLLEEHFQNIVDVKFTAGMESSLDEIEEGKADWVKVLHAFYGEFEETLDKAEKAMEGTRLKVPDEETDIVCELCGRKMVIKTGRYGKFLACPGFPECKNTKAITVETGGLCPLCGGKMLEKKSKRGRKFYGCEHNPSCSFMTWDLPIPETCPKCGATLFKKTGRDAKIYCAKEGCGYEREDRAE